jgi:hypothetical protein
MTEWNIVSSKKKKEVNTFKTKYLNKNLIGKFNKNKNQNYISNIINNKDIKNIYLDDDSCCIIGDILEATITDIKEYNNELTYFGKVNSIIRRKFYRLFGIIYKFDTQFYYIYCNILGKKYYIKTINDHSLKLLDKVIFEILNYQNNNNIFVKILYVLGNLKNKNEIFDTILIEENFIDCNNLVPLLNNIKNINELVNNKCINFYDKLINKSNDIFINMVDLTNYETSPNLDNLQFNKNYDKELLINNKINYNLKHEYDEFKAYYFNNNLFIYQQENNILKIGFLIDYFIGNRDVFNSGKQLFYRDLIINNLNKKDDTNLFLGNDYDKYFQTYKNNRNEKDFDEFLLSKKNHKIWTLYINLDNYKIEKYVFLNTSIKKVDNLCNSLKTSILNIHNNVTFFSYYYEVFDKNSFYIKILYSHLKKIILKDMKNNLELIPIKKINKYEYFNSFNNEKSDNINKNNSFSCLENEEYKNTHISTFLNSLTNSSIKDINEKLNLGITYSTIVSFNNNIFLDQLHLYYTKTNCFYKKIYEKLFNDKINYYKIYKPKNIYLINLNNIDECEDEIDTFFNPYNNFFDSYLLKLILKVKNMNIKKIELKDNYDNNIFKVLENCNISEKICYKVEQRYYYYSLFNYMYENIDKVLSKTYNGEIIYQKNNAVFINLSIENYNFLANIYSNNKYQINDIVNIEITNIDFVKKEIFISILE